MILDYTHIPVEKRFLLVPLFGDKNKMRFENFDDRKPLTAVFHHFLLRMRINVVTSHCPSEFCRHRHSERQESLFLLLYKVIRCYYLSILIAVKQYVNDQSTTSTAVTFSDLENLFQLLQSCGIPYIN